MDCKYSQRITCRTNQQEPDIILNTRNCTTNIKEK